MPRYTNTEYDIVKAFEAIENELIASLINNLDRHRAEEVKEGYNWTQWQAVQLAALDEYKRHNAKKYNKQFKNINGMIEQLISEYRAAGETDQEIEILEAIKKGFKAHKSKPGMTGEFFKVNNRKMDALIDATIHDLEKAEHAILRMANDKYRKTIFNAQVYAASGATYTKAVDMATRDFVAAGLNCVEYKNGARHTLSSYANMAIRTANKRAYLTGEGESRRSRGISTVIVNKQSGPCPLCLPFMNKILIDDVWSGGQASDGPYPLMSTAIAAGLYHPNCEDIHSTFFEGIDDEPDATWTKEEIAEIEKNVKLNTQKKNAERQYERCSRLAKYSLDEENKRIYKHRAEQWREKCKNIENMKNNLDNNFEGNYNNYRTKEELESVAAEIRKEISKYSKNNSKWSGIININNDLIGEGIAGQKEWDCKITVIDNVDNGTIWHEMLHSCSGSYYGKEIYQNNRYIEEASVEYLTQQICKQNNIKTNSAYEELTNVLQVINDKFEYGTDMEFGKELFNVPLPERYQWLEDKVENSLRENNVSFEDYYDVMRFVEKLKGG